MKLLYTKSSFNKKAQSEGFTLIEFLLSISIGFIIFGFCFVFLNTIYKLNFTLSEWTFSNQDSFYVFDDLESKIRNAVRFSPKEDLLVAGDNKYYGIASILSAQVPAYCFSSPSFNALIITSINKQQRPERLLRAFDEVSSSGVNSSSAELRLTADSTTDSMFKSSGGPNEIILIDGDRRYTRRYKVKSYVIHLNTHIDPYDDINKAPLQFNYVSVLVENPKNILGAIQNIKTAVFISNSLAFESNTYAFCMDINQKSYIATTIDNGYKRNVHIDVLNQSKLEKLIFSFSSANKNQRFDRNNFIEDIFDPTILNCVNAAKITTEFKSSNPTSKNIIRSKLFFLTNLNYNRPLNCN